MDPPTYFIVISIAAFIYVFYKATKCSVLDDIPGPASKSFLLGNLGELLLNQAGLWYFQTDFSWQETYGDVVKFKALCGERKELTRMISGKGIFWVDDNAHKRQQKVMLPGFRTPETKNFLPLFLSCAASLSRHWSDHLISLEKDQLHVFNISEWASRATLDALGQAAFDYNFGATGNHDNELGQVYPNMIFNAFGSPSKTTLVMLELLQFLPTSLVEFLNSNNLSRRVAVLLKVANVANAIAKELISKKSEVLLEGKGKKDLMSLLVKANAGENPRGQLSEDKILLPMRALIFAGHETTGNTLAWLLYELAQSPELQGKLCAEIRESELSIEDLEGMSLLGATVRETLRFYPAVLHLFRTAKEDDVLPLSAPIIMTNGEILTEIKMPKGSRVALSIPAYNRLIIFGEDAHMFNPYCWLEPEHVKKGRASLGPFANICLGWRFAIIELQAFTVELLSNFQFSAAPKTERIRRESAIFMVPTIEGEVENGAQLPLRVAFAPKGDE
ncbi:cytochrome P450 [Gymnopus androsaceus JB14]|uniref:Cytochrome P450 n=1 Tax=Gymnopus androsaceus JB14 TaxID=1447944 RepID=A0A6A4HHQ0_9AGAR|nr:cytochrome P450 [Gymnopus androsaceus JB14]